VAEVKRAIGALSEVPHHAMELFVKGEEEPLNDEKRLISAEKAPLFMLPTMPDRLVLGAFFKRPTGRSDGSAPPSWEKDAPFPGRQPAADRPGGLPGPHANAPPRLHALPVSTVIVPPCITQSLLCGGVHALAVREHDAMELEQAATAVHKNRSDTTMLLPGEICMVLLGDVHNRGCILRVCLQQA
jgi:hypothetical protein